MELLRQRLRNFLFKEGVSQKFIAVETNINPSKLSKFKNHKDDLGICDRTSLDKFLTSKGY
jgi:hypothetical protein